MFSLQIGIHYITGNVEVQKGKSPTKCSLHYPNGQAIASVQTSTCSAWMFKIYVRMKKMHQHQYVQGINDQHACN